MLTFKINIPIYSFFALCSKVESIM